MVHPHQCHMQILPCQKLRRQVSDWLKGVKFPDGYASNISRCVNVKEGKISGMKSHDCHIFFQRLLPVAIRPYLSNEIRTTLIELSFFLRNYVHEH